jgi:hypothetical protein
MKNKIILSFLFVTVSTGYGLSYFTIDRGMLTNHAEASFNGGAGIAQLSNGDSFQLRGFGDRVEFMGGSNQDWSFDTKVVRPDELARVNPFDFNEDDVRTITATALHLGGQQFKVDFIKIPWNNADVLRVIRVESIIPELSNMALIFGLIGMAYLGIKRRIKSTNQ